jgi:hypothetical protein
LVETKTVISSQVPMLWNFFLLRWRRG